MIAYLDSSAFVKLVKQEDESEALIAALGDWPDRASSRLLRIEVLRAARQAGRDAFERAATMLNDVALVPLSEAILEHAVDVDPAVVGTLDSIHLATALALGADLGVVVSYDVRLLEGAAAAGVESLSPGRG